MPYDMLTGVKVIELSMYAFAPSAAAVLADWGADVVKVVPPVSADPMRGNLIAGLPDKDIGISFMWEQVNRGKRCIALDVSQPEGRDLLLDLLADSDVFLTNLLPSARERFGIDVEHVQKVNPTIVYARASGHGAKGPEAGVGGFDHTDFWSRTGIGHAASMAGNEFVPQPGPALGDSSSGAFLAGGIAAALFRKEKTGQGSVVDVSLLSSGVWAFAPAIVASQLYEIDTIPRFSHLEQKNPLVTAYTTRDKRQIYFSGIRTDKNLAPLMELLGAPELADDPLFATPEARMANARACIEKLDEIFAREDLAHWVEKLRTTTIPWAVIQTAREASQDVQVQANGYVPTVQGDARDYPLVASPAQFDEQAPSLTRAPEHGEHTEIYLLERGIEWDRIEELKAQGVLN